MSELKTPEYNYFERIAKLEAERETHALNAVELMRQRDELRVTLALLLDHIDYKAGACRMNEMIGAVLPIELLGRARVALVQSALKAKV